MAKITEAEARRWDILIAGALEGDRKVWIYELAIEALEARERAAAGGDNDA